MSSLNSILENRGRPAQDEISIALISASGMVLHWYEATAIVQQVCQVLGNQPGHPVLDWSTIFVQSSGDVTIRSPGSGDADVSVRALGELLRTWLAENPYPMPLSLVVAQSTSTPPFYRSAAELSEALSHYERPDRLELIRNVYERWQSSDTSHGPPAEESPPPFSAELRRKARLLVSSTRVRALSLVEFARRTVRRLPRGVRRTTIPAERTRPTFTWLPWAAAVTLVAIGGGLIASGIGRPAASSVGAMVGRADDHLTEAVAARFGAVVNWVGRHFVRMPVSPPTSPAEAPVKATRRRTSGASQTRSDSPLDEPLEVSATPEGTTFLPPAPQEPDPPASPPLDPSTVYSGADADVTPPVAIDRQIQDKPPPGARAQNGVALEIVVDQMGRVESATLAKRPATLQEAMQATMNLSAAKSWRFRPALKAGQPVRYRRAVWLANR